MAAGRSTAGRPAAEVTGRRSSVEWSAETANGNGHSCVALAAYPPLPTYGYGLRAPSPPQMAGYLFTTAATTDKWGGE